MQYIFSLAALALGAYYFRMVSKRSTRIVSLIYFVLIFNMFNRYIMGTFHLPLAVGYVSDVVLVWILLEHFYKKKNNIISVPRSLLFFFVILISISIISFVVNGYSALLYIWGFRNTFRFIIFGMMCAVYLRMRDLKTIINILYGFFLLNILVVTHQAFFMTYTEGAEGDFISGLFTIASTRGGNAGLNWLTCILCAYAIIGFLYKKEKLSFLIVCLVGSIYMSTVGEIKVFYLQLVLIGVLAICICKKSIKAVSVCVVGAVLLVLGARVLYRLFPNFENFFEINNLIDYASRDTGYGSSRYNIAVGEKMGMDRLTALPIALNSFLPSIPQKIVGIGLGNADYSSFSFLTSSFYKAHNTLGYQYFTSAFIVIEMGLLGLISYIIMILNTVKEAITIRKNDISVIMFKNTAIIVSVLAAVMCFVNLSTKFENSAYLIFSLLAIPFIIKKTDVNETPLVKKISINGIINQIRR